jgi:hypothetical protein
LAADLKKEIGAASLVTFPHNIMLLLLLLLLP